MLLLFQLVQSDRNEDIKPHCHFHTNRTYNAATIYGRWRPMTNDTYGQVHQMEDDLACWLRNDSDNRLGKDSRLIFESQDGCIIPLNSIYNPIEFKQRIRFIGDSITKQHFETYGHWLGRKDAVNNQYYDYHPAALTIFKRYLLKYHNRTIPRTQSITKISSQSLKLGQSILLDRYLTFIRFDLFLYTNDIMAQAFIYLLLHLGFHQDDPLNYHDIVIFNFGIHGYQDSMESIRIFVKAWKSLGNRMGITLPLLLFRETSPQHFFPVLDYINQDRKYFNKTQYCIRLERISSNAYDFTTYFQSLVLKYEINHYAILHTFNITIDRYDEHPTLHWYNRNDTENHNTYYYPYFSDCTHYCFKSAVFRFWNGILNIFQAIHAGLI